MKASVFGYVVFPMLVRLPAGNVQPGVGNSGLGVGNNVIMRDTGFRVNM